MTDDTSTLTNIKMLPVQENRPPEGGKIESGVSTQIPQKQTETDKIGVGEVEVKRKEQERTTIAKALFLEQYIKSKGIIEHICEKVGMARSVYYEWIKEDKEFLGKITDLRSKEIYEVEDILKQLVFAKKDPGSVKFYLRSKHPDYKLKVQSEIIGVGVKSAKQMMDEYDAEMKQQHDTNNTTTITNTGEEKRNDEVRLDTVPLQDKKQEGAVSAIHIEQSTSVLLEKKDTPKLSSESKTKGNQQNHRCGPVARVHQERG
ncbi:MAG: hypothetical protein WAV09_04175 [Minisyncoccia bacterium]